MSDNYTKRAQQNMNAEIRRNAAREEARRDELAGIRRGEEQKRAEEREADAADPGVRRLLGEVAYKKYAAEQDAEQERQRLDAERTAAHNAELRDLYEAELRIWKATDHPASTFDTERWPEVLQRRHADTNAATDAEHQRRIESGRVF